MGLRYLQSETIARNVLRYLSHVNAESLLDIGAGSSISANVYLSNVRRYLAVEAHPVRAEALSASGIDVIASRFPTAVRGEFDCVLASHSLPELTESSIEEYPVFLQAAWGCVGRAGILILVTFKGNGGNLGPIVAEVFGPDTPPRDNGQSEYQAIMSTVLKFGPVRVERVTSYAVSDAAEEIVDYFTPWLNGTRRRMSGEQVARFRDIVEARFCVTPGLYVFPTEHLFISCRRQ